MGYDLAPYANKEDAFSYLAGFVAGAFLAYESMMGVPLLYALIPVIEIAGFCL